MNYPRYKANGLTTCPTGVNSKSHQYGITLIELMVSLILGLVIVGGVLNIFLSTNQTARVNDNLMRVQENARTAFDFMARDIRESGQNPCGAKSVANVLRSSAAIPVWADWNLGTLRGYNGTMNETGITAFGTTANSRASGTHALLVIRADQNENTISSHDTTAKLITLTSTSDFNENDIALACDGGSAAIFQLYDATPHNGTDKGKTLDYKKDNTNMNCSDLLGYPTPANCPTTTPPARQFKGTATPPNGVISKLLSSFWYVGISDSGQRSLYRSIITRSGTGGNTIIMSPSEMIQGVQDLQIKYLTRNGTTGILSTDWVGAADITNWIDDNTTAQVVAVRLDLTLQTSENIGTNRAAIQRHLIHVIGLRNRDTFADSSLPAASSAP